MSEFVGVQPRGNVDLFLDGLSPSEADVAVKSGDEAALRKALEAEPRHLDARLALGRLLLRQGRPAEAVEVLREAAHDPIGAGLLARAELAAEPSGDPEAAQALELYEQDPEAAFERLLEAVTGATGDRRDRLRAVTVGLFGERGADDPLTVQATAAVSRRRCISRLRWRRDPRSGHARPRPRLAQGDRHDRARRHARRGCARDAAPGRRLGAGQGRRAGRRDLHRTRHRPWLAADFDAAGTPRSPTG